MYENVTHEHGCRFKPPRHGRGDPCPTQPARCSCPWRHPCRTLPATSVRQWQNMTKLHCEWFWSFKTCHHLAGTSCPSPFICPGNAPGVHPLHQVRRPPWCQRGSIAKNDQKCMFQCFAPTPLHVWFLVSSENSKPERMKVNRDCRPNNGDNKGVRD